MTRLCLAAFAAFLLSQTAPVQGVVEDVRDFRERQYMTGQRVGCEMKLAMAMVEQDIEGSAALAEECVALDRRARDL